jgi:prepilin-type N-terminal cleavage/methylation domain-containing protein
MNHKGKYNGFSLTELLIVLVVIAVLFAALAPILAKKITNSSRIEETIWSYVKNDDYKDAYYDSGVPSNTGTAYIGLNPKSLRTFSQEPYSKVVIKAGKPGNKIQDHIQFRYGAASDGVLSGLVSLDNNSNIFMTTKLAGTRNNNFKTFQNNNPKGNTVAGAGAFAKATTAIDNITSIGANSTQGNSSYLRNVAFGNNSNQYSAALDSVIIGANTARGKFTPETVVIGASSLGLPTSAATTSVLLGYYAGATGFNVVSQSSGGSKYPSSNVVIGSQYYGDSPDYDTIIGNDTYVGGSPNAKYLTAIGANSCAAIQDTSTKSVSGTNTCIGYDTAKNYGLNNETSTLNWNVDGYDHIYLGGSPNGFGGRAVLEVHNIPQQKTTTTETPLPNLAPTVVLNSNLVVRGNTYFPNHTGAMTAKETGPIWLTRKSVSSYDKCRKPCGAIFKGKSWRVGPCDLLGAILGAFVGALIGAFTAGVGAVAVGATLSGIISTIGSSTLGAVLGSDDNPKRSEDPFSASFLYENSAVCASTSTTYLSGSTCPNLQLSDENLKNILSENTNGLSSIIELMPYNYTFKNDKSNTPQVGVMAQDLEKIFPNDVSKDNDGYLKIRWDGIFFATINSVKELNLINKNSEKDLSSIENDTKDIKLSHKNTKKRIVELNKRINKLEK